MTPRCSRCTSSSHLVTGDGPVVCRPCIAILTTAAARPERVSAGLREMLLELHGDVLGLHETDSGAITWVWTK